MKRPTPAAVPVLLLLLILPLAACGCPGPARHQPAPPAGVPNDPPARPEPESAPEPRPEPRPAAKPEPKPEPKAEPRPEAPRPADLVILDPLDWSAKALEVGGLTLQRSDGSIAVKAPDREKAASVLAGAVLALRRRLAVIAQNVANAETVRLPSAPAPGPAQPYRRKVLTVTASGALEVAEDKSAFRKVYRPGHPEADADGNVQLPNVYVEVELQDWRDTCREYEVLRLALAALSPRHVAPPAALIPEPVPPRPDEPKKTATEPPKPVTPVAPVPPAMPLPAPPK